MQFIIRDTQFWGNPNSCSTCLRKFQSTLSYAFSRSTCKWNLTFLPLSPLHSVENWKVNIFFILTRSSSWKKTLHSWLHRALSSLSKTFVLPCLRLFHVNAGPVWPSLHSLMQSTMFLHFDCLTGVPPLFSSPEITSFMSPESSQGRTKGKRQNPVGMEK